MAARRLLQFARLAGQMPRYLRSPLSPPIAAEEVKTRLAGRSAAFLDMARRCIYDHEQSPYRRLLAWAGCEFGDLERMVEQEGIEGALRKLRDSGVSIKTREFRGERPIRRNDLTIETGQADFENPLLAGTALEGKTSGTSSPSISAHYTWRLFREEAGTESLLLECHGLGGRPIAFYMPGPPAIAGLHNLLLHLMLGEPPRRWFSQLPPPAWNRAPVETAAAAFIRLCARYCGSDCPRIEHVPLDRTGRIVDWMKRSRDGRGSAVVKAYASSAVRLASAALESGVGGEGCIIFSGGEPLTGRRFNYIRGAGFRVFPRYAATETGMLGGACGRGDRHDEVHIYTDRVAVVPDDRETPADGAAATDLLFTSLSSSAPRVLLNASIGDIGMLERRPCDCPFGRLGMDLHLRGIGSIVKASVEGMTIPLATLGEIVQEVVGGSGGSPDDCQILVVTGADGVDRIRIAVHPRVTEIDEEAMVGKIRSGLAKGPGGGALAADLWRRAGTIQVVREAPRRAAGQKHSAVLLEREQVPDAGANRTPGE